MVVTMLGWKESQPSFPCSAGSACQCRYRAQPRCLTSTYHLVARASVDDARQLQRLHDCFKSGWGRFFWGPSYLDQLQLKNRNFFSEIGRKSPLLITNTLFSLNKLGLQSLQVFIASKFSSNLLSKMILSIRSWSLNHLDYLASCLGSIASSIQ